MGQPNKGAKWRTRAAGLQENLVKAIKHLIAGFMLTMLAPPAFSEDIQLEQLHGLYMVPVRINDALTIPFIIDSGASEVVIPADVFSTLRRTGTVSQTDFKGTAEVILADGSTVSADRYVIHKMVVGNHVIPEVIATVSPAKGDPLLGQSFFLKLPGWSIDNSRHALVLDEGHGEKREREPNSQFQFLDGTCAPSSHIAEGPLGTDLTKRQSRFYCNLATIILFDNYKGHVLVQFGQKESSHGQIIIGFGGLCKMMVAFKSIGVISRMIENLLLSVGCVSFFTKTGAAQRYFVLWSSTKPGGERLLWSVLI
jgi:predicted aspartyl protease